MPLTPEDVRNKRFQPVRLRREGYDMSEVDQFLDEVEAELERLLAENADLRGKLDLAGGGAAAPAPASGTPDSSEGGESAAPSAPAPVEQVKVTTAAEASSAATRLLELATRNADEVVAEARQEAQQIVASAQQQADTLDREARTRADNLDGETQVRRAELMTSLEQERARLDEEVDGLRTFEREYRSRLRSYFTQQLDALEGRGEGGELPAAHGHPQDTPHEGHDEHQPADNAAPDADGPAEGHS